MNSVGLIGNLTRDPESRDVKGFAVCNFSIAVNDPRKRGNEWVKETSFFDLVAWGRLADIAGQLRKGQPVFVGGKLKQQTWQTKDGGQRQKIVIEATDVWPLMRPEKREHNADDWSNAPPPHQATAPTQSGGESPSDEIPF